MPRTPARRRFSLFGFLIFALAFYLIPENLTISKSIPSVKHVKQETFVVKRVIDGDTFLLTNGEKIRLTGIDTPESRNNQKTRKDSQRTGTDIGSITVQGKQAAAFVKKLAEGKHIRLEYDVQKRDRYGRLLVYAYDISTLKNNPQIKLPYGVVVMPNQEIFLNGSIVGSGYAVPLTIPPNVKHAHLFKQLYREARINRRGLWKED